MLVDKENEEQLYVAKNKSPMLIGLANGYNIVASDALATFDVTDQYLELHDGDFAVVTKTTVSVFDQDGQDVHRAPITIKIDHAAATKGTYDTFMLKEIDEQPAVLRRISQHYLANNSSINVPAELLQLMAQLIGSTSWRPVRVTTQV